ncbi:type VI secretion system baseplate subunit TssG [Methylococcus sp. EFPC2]|uniref:type VI secretion system baseplate subunit TssG n=1 Tax=Methylococcus sp. EFPC2 TaxID=2812648 RepID=UPI0019680396|nr:type VI secretion system baseplate subunit TssG [Methylococcus sp. EFPC2]QSA96399.1 type VI secretion system baseplate subunit TssG [Methylococcus sp. EFPC2]
MADQGRTAPHDLIEALREQPQRYDFFQALRLIECQFPDKPRLGTSLRASEDPIRLAQLPELDFAPSTLAAVEPALAGIRPERLAVRFLGLFGPNGPLPLHLTEYANDRIRHHQDLTLARFADIFHHRMLSLFFRAWANARPTVSHDRPASDVYAGYVASLFGLGLDSLRDRDALPDLAKLHYAGLLASQTKNAEGLEAIVAGFLGFEVRVDEFVGEWMEIAPQDQTRLGGGAANGALGRSTVAGRFVWSRQYKFRIVLGPLSLDQYIAMLPGGRRLAELVAIVRNYIGDELSWDVNPILRRAEVPAMSLNGASRLGWTSWLGASPSASDAADLMLNPFFAMPADRHDALLAGAGATQGTR